MMLSITPARGIGAANGLLTSVTGRTPDLKHRGMEAPDVATTPKKSRKDTLNGRGPPTKPERGARLDFAISTFSTCVGEEAQLAAIMAHYGVKRLQARRILQQAKDE